MKSFRTDVRVSRSSNAILLRNSLLTIGSCFADAIGNRLHRNKFNVQANPFGPIYNPLSLHKALDYSIRDNGPGDHTYLSADDVYFNYDFHSQLSGSSKADLRNEIQNRLRTVHDVLLTADQLIITYGTAWVFTRIDTDEVVANCHKMNGNFFRKSVLSEEEIAESFAEVYERLKAVNPRIKIILTVSPVRHLKDTLPLNNLSKSILRVACHRIGQTHQDVEYFPSFEIMMDDLRDYRFYKADMIHPTEEAEDYIWEKFVECYFDDTTRSFLSQWQSIVSDLEHRSFHPASDKHQQFLKRLLQKIENIKDLVNVDQEHQRVRSQLI